MGMTGLLQVFFRCFGIFFIWLFFERRPAGGATWAF